LPFVFIFAVSSVFFAHPEIDPSATPDKHIEQVSEAARILKKLHKTYGIINPDSGIDAWSVYVLAGSVLLLLVSLTGIYLWLRHSRYRISGLFFLLASMATGISLLTVIRL
jgi:hypothetical protein